MKCLITEKFHESGIELLKEKGTVDIRYNICRENLLECIGEYDVLIVRSDTPVDKKLIDCAKQLKVVGMAGIGLNHIDTEYAKEKGQSLSEMVENYFKFVTVERVKIKEKQLSPKVRKLRGIIKTDNNFDHKQVLTEELSKKYGI